MTALSIQHLLSTTALPLIEARALLLHCLRRKPSKVEMYSTAYLIAHGNDLLESTIADDYMACVQRRLNGEPLAYIVEHREFWGRLFNCQSGVLIPRPDTEILCETALDYAHTLPASAFVLDLGCGSGILGITLACECPSIRVVMVDQSDTALAVSKENAKQLGVSERITLLKSNWFSTIQQQLPQTKFHLIVSNPPYIAPNDPHLQQGDLRFEPSEALVANEEGYSDLYHLIDNAPDYLISGGWLWLEHGYNQSLGCKNKFSHTYWNHPEHRHDLAGWTRLTGAQRK